MLSKQGGINQLKLALWMQTRTERAVALGHLPWAGATLPWAQAMMPEGTSKLYWLNVTTKGHWWSMKQHKLCALSSRHTGGHCSPQLCNYTSLNTELWGEHLYKWVTSRFLKVEKTKSFTLLSSLLKDSVLSRNFLFFSWWRSSICRSSASSLRWKWD